MADATVILVRAIDVTPYDYGIWCSIGDGEPFVNDVVARKWSECGSKIWFMLDSHNTVSSMPDDMLEVVRLERSPYVSDELLASVRKRDAENMGVKREAFEVSDVY